MNSQDTELTRKKRGPKRTTGQGTLVGLRLHADLLDPIDAWIAQQPEPLTRQQAIYRIISQWAVLKNKG